MSVLLVCPWCETRVPVSSAAPATCPQCHHRADRPPSGCDCPACSRPTDPPPTPPASACLCRGTGVMLMEGVSVPCWGCGGRATAGVYVLRVTGHGASHEPRFQTRDFRRANRKAYRYACLAARRTRRVESVSVAYYPASGKPARIVCTVPVGRVRRAVAVA